MARPAIIGPQIFEAVEKMTADQEMSKSDAFKAIAQNPTEHGVQMEGKSPGTVAAAYYRIQRKSGPGAEKPAQTAQTARTATPRKKVSSVDGDMADQLVQWANNAADALRREQAENQALRDRLARISETLGV